MSIKRRLNREKKRALILSKAKEVLKKHGKNTTMSLVAQELEMDTSSLYYYYKGIPEIINTLLQSEYHDLSTVHATLSKDNKTPLEILKTMVQMVMEFYYDNLEIMQIVLTQVSPLFLDRDHQEPSEAVNNYMHSYRTTSAELLQEIKLSQQSGELPDSFGALMILNILRGAVFGITAAWIEKKPERKSIPEFVQLLFSGLAVGPRN